VTEDALALWDTWVGMGGEGIVLKERASAYRPGLRSPAWLKLKPKLTLTATVTGGSSERIAWGHWGEAAMLAFRYIVRRMCPEHGREGESNSSNHRSSATEAQACGLPIPYRTRRLWGARFSSMTPSDSIYQVLCSWLRAHFG
jgi:ATP dependent DNA ligase domain